MERRPPRVFISYSHDTVEQQERVLGLADRLRADGIDAEIDQYNAAPSEGWPLWCERQIEAADVVLMVCTDTYHRRISGGGRKGGWPKALTPKKAQPPLVGLEIGVPVLDSWVQLACRRYPSMCGGGSCSRYRYGTAR